MSDISRRLVGLIKPILGDTKRNQLKGFMAAYKAGLGGRSCYRKYPCYANNLNTKRGKGTSREGDDLTLSDTSSNNNTSSSSNGTTVIVTNNKNQALFNATLEDSGSASVEERIVYDLSSDNSTREAP